MAEIRYDKKVTVQLREPMVNVGKHEGGAYNPQNNTTVFKGEVKVDAATAEDLNRRRNTWENHQDNLHRDNGTRDLEAGNLAGNQA